MKDKTQKRGQPSGASLPTVIMVIALMMTLAFTVVAIAFNHLNLSFRSNNNSKAESLAEAVLAKAIAKAQADPESFGNTGEQTVIVSFDSYPDGNRGVLSFNKDEALDLGVPYSTNNRSESPTDGSCSPRQSVPGQSFHLVARGEVGGAFSTMEAIVKIPKFPYSIASDGAITSNGGLLVASLKPGVAYDASQEIKDSDLEPGHLVSNLRGLGATGISMRGTNKIMGDLQSASEVDIEEGTEVLGKTRTQADQIKLPNLRAYDYEPRPEDNPQTINVASVGTLGVKGYNVSKSLTVDNGIKLNGGVLFVEGKLIVDAGGVSGKGAIIATEGIEIRGSGEATSDNQAALISDGDIILSGDRDGTKAKFTGLIYTKKNLKSDNLRLAGVFVAAGENSQVEMKDTELYHVEDYAQIELTGPKFHLPNLLPPPSNFNGIPFEATYDFSDLEARLENYRNPDTGAGQPTYLFKFKSGSQYKTYVNDSNGVPQMVDTGGPDSYLLDGGDLGLKLFGQSVTSESDAEAVIVAEVQSRLAAEGKTLSDPEISTLRSMARSYYDSFQTGREFALTSAEQTLANGGPTDPTGPSANFSWSLDLSEFVSESERMRVLYWARYR